MPRMGTALVSMAFNAAVFSVTRNLVENQKSTKSTEDLTLL